VTPTPPDRLHPIAYAWMVAAVVLAVVLWQTGVMSGAAVFGALAGCAVAGLIVVVSRRIEQRR